MKKSSMYAIVAVVIIIIIVAGVAAWYYTGGMGGETTPTETPTASPASVADASSISFDAAVTSGGTTTTYTWQGMDIHSNDVTFRVDLEGGYSYILNAGTQEAFESTDGGATWTTGDFQTDWAAWGATWQDYLDNLAHWNGSDATYTIEDATIGSAVVSNIMVNPTIPASTFNQ